MTTQLIVTREHTADGLLPIRHLSYSAIRSFLQSENLFFKRYVRLEFDNKEKPSMLIGKAGHETIEKYWQDQHFNTREEGAPDPTVLFYIEYAQGVFTRMLQEAREKAAERLEFKKVPSEDAENPSNAYIDKNGEYIHDADERIEAEAIEWSKTIDEQKAREQLSIAVKNYIENADNSETISTEISETVEFTDLDGEVMPLPLKGIIDRIERSELGEGLRDYKIVASFSDQNERNAGYEMQAAAFYFVYQGIKGKAPEYAIFEEVLKKESGYILPEDPTKKLLQADLRELCEKHQLGWEKFEKNAQLQEKLLFAKILEKEPAVKRIIYKYSERQDILEAFLEIYKRIINRLGLIALYQVPYSELVNPFDQMNGSEAWKDFTEGLGQDNRMKRAEKPQENDDLDDFEF
jgi:hypothetical protein